MSLNIDSFDLFHKIHNDACPLFEDSESQTNLFNFLAEYQKDLLAYTEENPEFRGKLKEYLFRCHKKILNKEIDGKIGGSEWGQINKQKESFIIDDAKKFASNELDYLYDPAPDRTIQALMKRKTEVRSPEEISKFVTNVIRKSGVPLFGKNRLRAVAEVRKEFRKRVGEIDRNISHFKEMIEMVALELEKEQAAAKAAEALISAEAAKKRKGTRGKKRIAPKRSVERPKVVSEGKQEVSIPTTNPVQELSKVADNRLDRLQQRRCRFKFARRVLRWKTSNPDDIRTFRDRGGAKLYSEMSDEEALQKRAEHLFPGVPNLFSEDGDRQIYTFPTKTGLGLMVQFNEDERDVFGVLYYGIDRQLIYHCQFVPLKDQDSARIILDRTYGKLPSDRVSNEEGWVATTDYIFHREEEEVISVEYPKEKYGLSIFPVRRSAKGFKEEKNENSR